MSLKAAAESLTGGACYHMHEVFRRDDAALWCRVLSGETDVLDDILDGFEVVLDWPASSVWSEMADRYPDAAVLLSHRGDAQTWWSSADATVWSVMRGRKDIASAEWWEMTHKLQDRFADRWDDRELAMAAYDAHVSLVRSTIADDRLFEYQPGDGWGPLCAALGLVEPDEPFPHLNSRDEFVDRQERG